MRSVEPECQLETAQGALRLAQFAQDAAQIVERSGIAGTAFESTLIARHCVVKTSEPLQCGGPVVPGLGIIGLERHGPVGGMERCRGVTRIQQRFREIGMRIGLQRVDVDGPLQQRDAGREFAVLHRQRTEQMQHVEAARCACEQFTIDPLRRGKLAALVKLDRGQQAGVLRGRQSRG